MSKGNGDDRITMKMVAKKAGVSVSAVSLALRNDPQIASATRERIQKVAREMGFVQNPVIGQLMSELRNAKRPGATRTIGLLNAHPHVSRLSEHNSLPFVAEGCRRRVEATGYRCEEIWLNEPGLDAKMLNHRLTEHGIRGVVIIGVRSGSDALLRFATTWATHACVVVGARPQDVELSWCCTDFFQLARDAVAKAIAFGYKRPALVVDEQLNLLTENMLTVGARAGQEALPEVDRIRSFGAIDSVRANPSGFADWFTKYAPDVILTLHRRTVCSWLDGLRRKVPEDVGVIVLDRRKNAEGWACMDQQGDRLGEYAIDLLMAALAHGEIGVPKIRRSAMIPGIWIHGDSVVNRNETESAAVGNGNGDGAFGPLGGA